MTPQQISALQGFALAIVALLVTLGLIGEDASRGVIAAVTSAFVALGAFIVKRPKDH